MKQCKRILRPCRKPGISFQRFHNCFRWQWLCKDKIQQLFIRAASYFEPINLSQPANEAALISAPPNKSVRKKYSSSVMKNCMLKWCDLLFSLLPLKTTMIIQLPLWKLPIKDRGTSIIYQIKNTEVKNSNCINLFFNKLV